MKKFTNLLIVCSLALAGAVMAQKPTPEESQSPGKKADKKAPAEVKPKAPGAPKTEAPAVAPKTQAPAVKEPAANEPPPRPKVDKKAPSTKKSAPATAPETKTSTDLPATTTTPADKKQQSQQRSSETMKSPAASAKTSPSATAAAKTTDTPATKTTATATPATKTAATATPASAKATATPATAAASATPAAKATATPAAATTASATPAAATTASATPAAATTASATPAAATTASATPASAQTSPGTTPVNPSAAKKPEPSKIQQIKERHANFRAQPRPDRVPAVTFTPNYRVQGSEQWQGPQYEVYRSYRPERRDQRWYQSRYNRVELIGGGYYYWDNGYWYPAWGYSPAHEYYAYDAPIYVGKRAEPLDKVIAEVQAVLQEMGYYKGEVDGLIGPLTREALIGYQNDYGLTRTAVIDEPTLNSLGLG